LENSRTKRSHASRRKASRRSAFESLENRRVFAASFGSALGIGSDEISGQMAWDVAADSAGNSYLTGSFAGTVDFDPSSTHLNDADILTARGSELNKNSGDIFVAKYAPDNSLVWVTRMGGDTINAGNSDTGRAISVDGTGSVYVVGKFCGTADFGSTALTSAGHTDGFVTKLSPNGVIQWANRWGAMEQPDNFGDDGYSVDVDATGNVYAVGTRFNAGVDVRKYDPNGSLVWTKSVETRTTGVDTSLTASSTGDVFVAGSFYGTVDFDPSQKKQNVFSGTNYSAYVLKLDRDGNFGWVSPFVALGSGSSAGWSSAQTISLDGSGNVIVGGYYGNSVDFDPGKRTTTLPSIGGTFVVKLTSSGSLVWARALEDDETMFLKGIDVDATGSVYATGYFNGTADFNPAASNGLRTSAGGGDIFVVKLNSAGNFAWVETFGSTGSDMGTGIAVDAAGVIHIAGSYQYTVDFDPEPNLAFELTSNFRSKALRLRLLQT
jgi:hypothetical protein